MKPICGFILLLICILPSTLSSEKILTLTEFKKPSFIAIAYEKIYITDQDSIHIFSADKPKFIKRFGKEGEGPGEFLITWGNRHMTLSIYPHRQKLAIANITKLSFFSPMGEFDSEKKTEVYMTPIPIGSSYVSSSSFTKNDMPYMTIAIFDQSVKRVKNIYISDVSLDSNQKMYFPFDPLSYVVSNDEIFCSTDKLKFVIDVFDEQGNKKRRLTQNLPLKKIDPSYKNYVIDWFKTDPMLKDYWDHYKDKLAFKDYYPAIANIFVNDGKVYALTHQRDKNLNECIIISTEGKLLKKTMVKLPQVNPQEFVPYTIHQNHLYSILENEQKECWELHRNKID
jgi:hypothetical protein